MKKILIIISMLLIVLGAGFTGFYIHNKNKEKIIEIDINELEITISDNLNLEFLSDVKISDLITVNNYTLLNDNIINTKNVGKQEIPLELKLENVTYKTQFEIEVVDTVSPLVWLGENYNLTIGSNPNFVSNIICVDNYDDYPKCEVIGEYNVYKLGTYPLTFKATDNSGNVTTKEFKLNIVNDASTSNPYTYTYYSDIVKKHKNENTEIGIDVSEWQGNIDYEALKNAGVEFAILRVGSETKEGRFVDDKFKDNVEGFKKVGIPVGVYYYSYAENNEYALEDAKYVYEAMGKEYEAAIKYLTDNGCTIGNRKAIVCQGENDVSTLNTQLYFDNNNTKLTSTQINELTKAEKLEYKTSNYEKILS